MQTQIYFVRHGEVYNPNNIWYGRLPRFGLSDRGRKQITQTATFLTTQNITQLYASPVLRAKQTAQIIHKELHLPIQYSKSLMEIRTSLQGTPFPEIAKRNYDVFAATDKPDVIGETIDDLANRMKRFIRIASQKHPGERIVAVSHGDPIMITRAIIENLPISNDSLRPGKEKYIHHGEVFLVTKTDTKLTLTMLFKPNE